VIVLAHFLLSFTAESVEIKLELPQNHLTF